jgi:hypothetical protein
VRLYTRRGFNWVSRYPRIVEALRSLRRPQERATEIKRAGSQQSGKGPAAWFTGTVRIDPLFQATEPARAAGNSVTFEPGARTAWHDGNDTYRLSGGAEWEARGLDGTGERRAIPKVGRFSWRRST